ncbi:MAG: hypothetical protein LBR96_02515 [Treponema sp.]|jgi:hypothetical protein|nr:hypothetical protein [Treponema sp.]
MPHLFAFVFCVLFLGCSGGKNTEAPPPGDSGGLYRDALHPDYIIEAGRYPLWFEFSAEGLTAISSPGEASLTPFKPWPLARHVRGILKHGGELTLVINREGFIVVSPAPGPSPESLQAAGPLSKPEEALSVYICADPAFWGSYTAAAAFMYQGSPAALLYRDDFFAENTVPAPRPRVWTPDIASRRPIPLAVPALDALPPSKGWDIDAMSRGDDGYWYFRAVRKPALQPRIQFYRSKDLEAEAEASSQAEFQNSFTREAENNAPDSGLPPLPAGFVYTARGLSGGALVAAWEEQEGFNIGAAGLMLMLPER